MTASAGASDAALPIYTSNVTLPLYISPSYLAFPMEGVREQLNRSVLRYVEQLGGVLLSYANLRLQRPLGRIAFDAPEIHIRVEFDATYFAPAAGDVIEGTVSRIGGDHIALLVLGVFNASIARPAGWDSAKPSVKPDDKARFAVQTLHNSNGLLTMHGELTTAPACVAAPPVSVPAASSRVGAARSGRAHSNGATAAAAATPVPAAPAAEASAEGSGKRKRSSEEKEERRRRKSEAAAAAAAAEAEAAAAAAAAAAPVAADGKVKRSKEEKAKRKAEKAAARAARDTVGDGRSLG